MIDGAGSGSAKAGEDARLLVSYIVQTLRDAGIGCEVISSPPRASALRRDVAVIVLALALLTLLSWSWSL